jgi:hypothetical protein
MKQALAGHIVKLMGARAACKQHAGSSSLGMLPHHSMHDMIYVFKQLFCGLPLPPYARPPV